MEPYKKWLCVICGFIYDEEKGWPRDGIDPGTRWQDVPEDWVCPDCLVGKADFDMMPLPASAITTSSSASSVQISSVASIAPQTAAGPIVIVGSGYGGYNLVEALRHQNTNVEIVLLTQDDGMHYAKPALSTGLVNQQDADDLVSDKPLDMANRLNLRIVTHCKVTSIDSQAKVLSTNLGQQPYGQLVLATGAQPIRPSIAGDAAKHVLCVNDLQDYRAYRQALHDKQKVLLIGNGLIGCEFANDLAVSGYGVDLVGLTSWPIDRFLPEGLGRQLQTSLEELGVNWYLDNTVVRVDYLNPQDSDAGYRVTLQDDRVIETQVIISAIGLRARTELAKMAYLDTGVGIIVDDYLATSGKDIYALGDCIEVKGQLMPYIAPIYWGIQALAKTLTGTLSVVSYPPMTVLVKTPACPLTLLPPPTNTQGEWQVQAINQGHIARFVDSSGQLAGFALQGKGVELRAQMLEQMRDCS